MDGLRPSTMIMSSNKNYLMPPSSVEFPFCNVGLLSTVLGSSTLEVGSATASSAEDLKVPRVT